MVEQQASNRTYARPGESYPPGGPVDLAREEFQNTPLAIAEIRPNVFTFSGAGGTVTSVCGSQGCAIVDTGYGPRVDEIRRGIAQKFRQSPRWLINTHFHYDHTDGNATFAEHGATIIAHASCRARLSQGQFIAPLEWKIPAAPRAAWPVVTFDAPITIDLVGQTLQLIPQESAHTDGDVVIWLPSANVLITGDLLNNDGYPVIDAASHGSLRGIIQAVERLLQIVNAETVVVPGHGPIGNRAALLGFHRMLSTIDGRIESMIKSHRPVAEILAAAPTADFDSVWGRGYVTGAIFVRMILAGYSA